MKLIPFLMPGFPSINASRDVFRFLQSQSNVIIETALPTMAHSSSALVQKIQKTANRAGIKPDDVIATFQKDRKTHSGMLMLHQEPDGHEFSQIITAFDYAIAPFAAEKVAQLNTQAKGKPADLFAPTQFGSQVGPDDQDLEKKVQASEGFVYLKISEERQGILNSKEKITSAIQKIKTVKNIDVFCGFGVKNPNDVRMLKAAGADGIFLGAEALHAQEKGLAQFKEFWKGIQTAAEA